MHHQPQRRAGMFRFHFRKLTDEEKKKPALIEIGDGLSGFRLEGLLVYVFIAMVVASIVVPIWYAMTMKV